MAAKTKVIPGNLANLVGRRGEIYAEELLTDYRHFKKPLFELSHLGDKWAVTDFYAELYPVRRLKPVALFQVKTRACTVRQNATTFHCALSKKDAIRLGHLPLPCYLIGVSEWSRRVFIRAVPKARKKGMSTIPVANELTVARLRDLHREIAEWWRNNGNITSQFL